MKEKVNKWVINEERRHNDAKEEEDRKKEEKWALQGLRPPVHVGMPPSPTPSPTHPHRSSLPISHVKSNVIKYL